MSDSYITESNQTSSARAGWPPAPSSHNRLRGFYDRSVVRTPDQVAEFAAEFASWRSELQAHPTLDRLSLRCIGSLAVIGALEAHGVTVETVIPMSNTEPNMAIVYVGWNDADRHVAPERFAASRELLRRVTAQTVKPIDCAVELGRRGYAARLIDRNTLEPVRTALADRFMALYSIFGYSQEDVRELLANPCNTIAYIQNAAGEVVSTAMAEEVELDVDGLDPLRIVEITEASTHPDYRGRGLYRLVSGMLVSELLQCHRQNGRPLNALYGECNLMTPGVLVAAHQNGRRFSHFDGVQLGTNQPSEFGILPQNVRVDDGTETRAFNDFATSYYPPEVLE